MRPGRVLGALTVLALAIASPSDGRALPATGVIFDGVWGGGRATAGCVGVYGLRFAGRMPAGDQGRAVVRGTGQVDCTFQSGHGPTRLHGETPTGPIDWICYGTWVFHRNPDEIDLDHPVPAFVEGVKEAAADALPPRLGEPVGDAIGKVQGIGNNGYLVYPASCVTEGFPASFTLKILLVAGQVSFPDPYTPMWPVKGMYWVGPQVA